jgi:hypothetical protein
MGMMLTKNYFDQRHGGPYDRGSADAYYRRGYDPHYFRGATYSSTRIGREKMTPAEIEAYKQGWDDTHEEGFYK